MFPFRRPKRVYLDYAAATPVRPEVLDVMRPFFSEKFANPGAIHQEGQRASKAVEDSRLQVARLLGIRPSGITWTASGTEANNLAIYGTIRHLTEKEGKKLEDLEIISTNLEHPSVTEVLSHLQSRGVSVKYAPVKEDGRIDINQLTKLLNENTALVTFAYVNSEIGVIEDVKGIARQVRKFNDANKTEIKIHLDAAQAPLWLSCSLEQLGVDLLSLDAGKCYGPKGVGLLARRHGVQLEGFVLGGGQEGGLRSGTENTPLIVGAARAFVMAQENYEERSESVQKLRDSMISALTSIEGIELNGSLEHRVANNVNVSIEGVEAEFAAVTLDVAGIACSTKSACGSSKEGGSKVVRMITGSEGRATTSLRFTLGEETTRRDLERTIAVLKDHIEKTRKFNI